MRSRIPRAAFCLLAAWYVAAFPVSATDARVITHTRSTILAVKGPAVFYTGSLDLGRFASPDHGRILDTYLHGKFRDVHIDVLVAFGARALEGQNQ